MASLAAAAVSDAEAEAVSEGLALAEGEVLADWLGEEHAITFDLGQSDFRRALTFAEDGSVVPEERIWPLLLIVAGVLLLLVAYRRRGDGDGARR